MRYSFGVSRTSMKKLYVDDIIKQGKDNSSPGPDKYTMEQGFGTEKTGSRYSMRPKNDLFELHLEKSKKLPGPGNYIGSVDLAGKAQLNSRLQNQPQNRFPQAGDRFRITGFKNPAPTDYEPKSNLNQNVKSEFRYMGATKFTQSTRTFMDVNWNPREKAALPAPGQYTAFSDFSGLDTK